MDHRLDLCLKWCDNELSWDGRCVWLCKICNCHLSDLDQCYYHVMTKKHKRIYFETNPALAVVHLQEMD